MRLRVYKEYGFLRSSYLVQKLCLEDLICVPVLLLVLWLGQVT